MKHSLLFLTVLLALHQSHAGEAAKPQTKAPALIELRDQYDTPQRLAFPATNVVILTIADKKGSDQIDGWVTALKARYAGRIELRGLADVGSVPGLLRGKVRKKFQETRPYPVMMDWSGQVCAQFGFQPGVANVLVIARDGTIQSRLHGAAGDAARQRAFSAIDAALNKAPVSATNSPAKPSSSIPP